MGLSQQLRLSKVALPLILAALILGGGPGSLFQTGATPAYAQEDIPLETIRFSSASLIPDQPFELTLTGQRAGTIYYTTNGSLPSVNSIP